MALRHDKVRGSLLGLFIGDALAMPAHWYYNQNDIFADFRGWIKDFEPASLQHPTSIMSVSSTGGHGRGDQSGDIIGSVILHGKKEFWGKPRVHYHHGMARGENTLNAQVARVLLRSVASRQQYSPEGFLDDYVSFMTTPGTHNDTYAESYHRDFFRNFVDKKPLRQCAGKEDHNTASVGGLVMLPVLALHGHYRGSPRSTTIQQCLEHLRLTHQSHALEEYIQVYLNLYISVLEHPMHPIPQDAFVELVDHACKSLPDAFDLKRLLQQFPDKNDPKADAKIVGRMFSPACYIQDSLPSVLYFAGKYADCKIVPGLLANTNVGGDNCHRGAALGALLGAAFGESRLEDHWKKDLVAYDQISQEITRFEAILSNESQL